MNPQLAGRLELNIFNPNTNPQYVSDLVIKNRIQTIVTKSEYVAELITHRSARNGQYRIICTIDFPDGRNFAMDKLKRSHPDFIAADGFEILLSPDKTEIEARNEMKAIFEFIKMQNRLAEIRWCLGSYYRDGDDAERILKNMKMYPPSFVRTDPHLKIPNIGIDEHIEAIKRIQSFIPYPVKVSGNVDLELIHALDEYKVARFDISVDQFKKSVVDLKVEDVVPDPVSKLDGVRKAQVRNMITNSGLRVQRRKFQRGRLK